MSGQSTIPDLISSLDPNLKHAITLKFVRLQELGAVWQTASASLSSEHVQPWPTFPTLSLPIHSRTRAAIPPSATNRFKDDDGVLALGTWDDDSQNSVDGELDPITEVDITIGDAIDHDALRISE
jgi:hypothetical protein